MLTNPNPTLKNFLCSRNHCPTASDRLMQIQLPRYLKGHPDVGPVFSSAPGPIEIVGSSDSHAVHVDGASHTGHTLSIGADNAAFSVTSVAERFSVSPDAMSAEYRRISIPVRHESEIRARSPKIGPK